MECAEKLDYLNNASVFTLLTKLCEKILLEYCGNEFGSINHELIRRMRSKAYEIILKKSDCCIEFREPEPVLDLISYSFILNVKQHSVEDFRNVDKLKELVDWAIEEKKQRKADDTFVNILQCLVNLKDSMPSNNGQTSFQNPFSFGKLDEMLPKPPKFNAGDPEPYHYFPPHLFELPFSMRNSPKAALLKRNTETYQPYDASLFSIKKSTTIPKQTDERDHCMNSMTTSLVTKTPHPEKYPLDGCLLFPRLTTPRDLSFVHNTTTASNSESVLSAKSSECQMSPKYIIESSKSSVGQIEHYCHTPAIWEMASSSNSLPDDLWETVSKMPPKQERNLITMSQHDMALWKETHKGKLHHLNIVSEVKLINHLMYLLLGIETSSFILDADMDGFKVAAGLCLEGVSQEGLGGYLMDFLTVGTFYHRLNKIVSTDKCEGMLLTKGFIFEAMCDRLREYLLKFGMKIFDICNKTSSSLVVPNSVLPTLLKILYEIRPMRREIETVAKIYKVTTKDGNNVLGKGASLMAYLYQEVTLLTHQQHAKLFYETLIATCKVYFKFVQRFIFEGELDDCHGEFFITKDPNCVESPSKRYWDKGFSIRNEEVVPEFAKGLAENILLCGKSFRLLKLCNPEDPLCILLSSEHPVISCCTTFEQIEHQQKLMNVFRTRCLFVCGEPITFRDMLVRKEAERKAFCELAQIKNAETLQKIVEERKRLQRILHEEKLHCQQMLVKAAREAKEARESRGPRGRAIAALQDALTQAQKRTEDLIIEDEKKKMIEYYNELGQEVEKRKVRSEWKIKRLKLDEMRVQLLTSEERNFKREKIELKYRNSSDDTMPQSLDVSMSFCDSLNENFNSINKLLSGDTKNNNLLPEISTITTVQSDVLGNETVRNSDEDLIVIFKADSSEALDNRVTLSDINENPIVKKTSSSTVSISNTSYEILDRESKDSRFRGMNLEDDFLTRKYEAEHNKLKVLSQEFGMNDTKTVKKIKTIYCASEAEINRDKVVGSTWMKEDDTNCNLIQSQLDMKELQVHRATEAETNRDKVLGSTWMKEDDTHRKEPQSQLDKKELQVHCATEAETNRDKVLGSTWMKEDDTNCNEPQSQSDKKELQVHYSSEAEINRDKVLGSTWMDQDDTNSNANLEPHSKFDTEESRQALRNKQKVLNQEYGMFSDSKERVGLTLDLNRAQKSKKLNWKHWEDPKVPTPSTPVYDLHTPSDVFNQLDLETPTCEVVSEPSSDSISHHLSTNTSMHCHRVSTDGFTFPSLIIETSDDEDDIDDTIIENELENEVDAPIGNQLTFRDDCYNVRSCVWNFTDDFLNFDSFVTCGIKGTDLYSALPFTSQMMLDEKNSFYTPLGDILHEAQKKPMEDLYMMKTLNKNKDEDCDVSNTDFSTLSACLRRSVMVPLTYQMEMVNNAVLKYFLVDLDLYEHLKSLCDCFFLMDAEFSSTICRSLFKKLKFTTNPNELLNFATLHNMLDKAFGLSIGATQKFSSNLSFTVDDPPVSFQHSSPDVLQCLTLSYCVPWPLNIIISPEAITRYARVFQFLVKMRRISWVLGEDFEGLKVSLKEKFFIRRNLLHSPQYHSVQIYRHSMASFIRALDNYIVTTCIQTSWKEFERNLMDVQTLDSLHICHVMYIKNVVFRCLLNKRSVPLMRVLNELFSTILKFHHSLNARCWHIAENEENYSHPLFKELQAHFETFEKWAKYFHKFTIKLTERGYQPHLVELLTMINMNDFYKC